MTTITEQQCKKFDVIVLGNSHTRALEQLRQLSFDENVKLKKIMDQKIAFMSAYRPSKPPTSYQQSEQVNHIPSFFGTVCCFLFPESNRDTFDITDQIFIKRFFSVFLFWKKGFTAVGGPKTDMYGPVWLSFLYITLIGLSANLNVYFNNIIHFKTIDGFYAQAIGLLLVFTVLQFLIYPMIVGCYNGFINTNQSITLLGYSLVLYYIPTILCSFPSLSWHLTMLGIGGFLRSVFLFRNYGAKIDSNGLPLLITILLFELAYFYFTFQAIFREQSGYSFQQGIDQVFFASSLSGAAAALPNTTLNTTTAHLSLRTHCFFKTH